MASAADSTAVLPSGTCATVRSTAHARLTAVGLAAASAARPFHRSHVHSPGADVPSGGERDAQRAGYPDRGCSPNSQRGDGLDDLVNRRQPHDDVRARQLTLIDGDDDPITPGKRATSEHQVVINLFMSTRQGLLHASGPGGPQRRLSRVPRLLTGTVGQLVHTGENTVGERLVEPTQEVEQVCTREPVAHQVGAFVNAQRAWASGIGVGSSSNRNGNPAVARARTHSSADGTSS